MLLLFWLGGCATTSEVPYGLVDYRSIERVFSSDDDISVDLPLGWFIYQNSEMFQIWIADESYSNLLTVKKISLPSGDLAEEKEEQLEKIASIHLKGKKALKSNIDLVFLNQIKFRINDKNCIGYEILKSGNILSRVVIYSSRKSWYVCEISSDAGKLTSEHFRLQNSIIRSQI